MSSRSYFQNCVHSTWLRAGGVSDPQLFKAFTYAETGAKK